MLIQETLISPRGKRVSRIKEIACPLHEYIAKIDMRGWRIVEIRKVGGEKIGDKRKNPGDYGAVSGG
jgi:hypothetical protein